MEHMVFINSEIKENLVFPNHRFLGLVEQIAINFFLRRGPSQDISFHRAREIHSAR